LQRRSGLSSPSRSTPPHAAHETGVRSGTPETRMRLRGRVWTIPKRIYAGHRGGQGRGRTANLPLSGQSA
jgi:hypothetical protein